MANTWPVLPDHLIEDIFARLPAKSVHRFLCLSRTWAALLSSDDFADGHHKLANRPSCPKILLLQDSLCHGPKMQMWSPEHPSGAKLMDIPCDLTRDTFPYNPATFLDRRFTNLDYNVPRLITQQCRGLVILEATALEIYYVCNPSTSQMIALPEGRTTGCRGRKESTQKYASLGLGYDLCVRKHKIVRIYYGGCNAEKFPISSGCEVYVVNSTGLWRPPKSGVQEKPAGWVNKYERSVFAHGYIYWLAQRKLEFPSEIFIVSFSLRYENFGILTPPVSTPLPLGTENNTLVKHHLTDLDGRLCLSCTDMDNSWPLRYHIWLLRGYEASTWDLHYQIDLTTVSPEAYKFFFIGAGIIPAAIVDNGRRILFIQPRYPYSRAPSFKICAYDPVTRDIDNLMGTAGFVTHQSMVLKHAALYEESMAFPGQQYVDVIFAMSLVLRRLPAYALARLKCVCRSWRIMIESNRFDLARRTCSEFRNY